jgi:hypothetical protein
MAIISSSSSSELVECAYPGLLEARRRDMHSKPVTEGELLADAFKVVDRDLYYAYAITAHKAQGSTYDAVMVDEADFARIDRAVTTDNEGNVYWRTKEKNQLRYVAYTRARERVYMLI